ncbi:MAG: hypothetical protein QF661_09225, partial [Arenicellales bacterium]|nr:hypothetical protein [Arenicellales bacterium]
IGQGQCEVGKGFFVPGHQVGSTFWNHLKGTPVEKYEWIGCVNAKSEPTGFVGPVILLQHEGGRPMYGVPAQRYAAGFLGSSVIPL